MSVYYAADGLGLPSGRERIDDRYGVGGVTSLGGSGPPQGGENSGSQNRARPIISASSQLSARKLSSHLVRTDFPSNRHTGTVVASICISSHIAPADGLPPTRVPHRPAPSLDPQQRVVKAFRVIGRSVDDAGTCVRTSPFISAAERRRQRPAPVRSRSGQDAAPSSPITAPCAGMATSDGRRRQAA